MAGAFSPLCSDVLSQRRGCVWLCLGEPAADQHGLCHGSEKAQPCAMVLCGI